MRCWPAPAPLLLLLLAAASAAAPAGTAAAAAAEEDAACLRPPACPSPREPWGLRLALTGEEGEMRVLWNTEEAMAESCVQLSAVEEQEAGTGGGSSRSRGGLLSTGRSSSCSSLGSSGGSSSDVRRQLAAAWEAASKARLAAGAASAFVCGRSRPVWEPSLNASSSTLHDVLVTGLDPGRRYSYRVGSGPEGAWSAWWAFRARRSPGQFTSSAPLRLLLAGDLGVANARCLPRLIEEAAGGGHDAFLLLGDLAYDLADLQGRRAAQFLRLVEPLSARLPFLVIPGNHEAASNFSHYRQLWAMPGWREVENLRWSLALGPLRLLALNSEAFFWPEWLGEGQRASQHAWLRAQLARAKSERTAVPWVLAAAHRPLYCSLPSAGGACGEQYEAMRLGLPSSCPRDNPRACRRIAGARAFPLEPLLFEGGVDLAVYGHVHSYERFAPVYNKTVRQGPGSTFDALHNPGATVHVTSGAGGNKEMRPPGGDPPSRGRCSGDAPWCMFQSGRAPRPGQSADYSYSRLTVWNASHAQWQQVSVTARRVVDDWWVVQEQHGPFPPAAAADEA